MSQPILKDQSSVNYIFLDTCVIQDLGSSNKSKSEAVLKLLDDLTSQKFRLVISEFTIYENLQGLLGQRAKSASETLYKFETKTVSREVLTLASFLQGLYHDEKIDNISDGDKIIGSTAILEAGKVLTRNHKDFPSPFYIAEKFFALTYETGKTKMTLDIGLYNPNVPLIVRRMEANKNK